MENKKQALNKLMDIAAREYAQKRISDIGDDIIQGLVEDAYRAGIREGYTMKPFKETAAAASPPSPAIEGKEEDGRVLRWVNGNKRKPPKDHYDEPSTYLVRGKGDDPRSGWVFVAYMTLEEIGEGIFVDYWEWLEEISPPTPPAGAEGERPEAVRLRCKEGGNAWARDHDKPENYKVSRMAFEQGALLMFDGVRKGMYDEYLQQRGAEGEQTMEELEKEYDVLESINYKATKKIITLENELSAAQSRIAALEAELSRQISLKDHCLITMDDMKKAREKVEAEKEDYRKALDDYLVKLVEMADWAWREHHRGEAHQIKMLLEKYGHELDQFRKLKP